MKIDSYEVLNNTLVLHFNINFKQINYTKMSYLIPILSESKSGELDCEQIELKYSKNKNTLNIPTDVNVDFIVILITKVDKKSCHYSYYINLKSNNLLQDQKPTLTNNLINRTGTLSIKINPIKNQNIFANIKKKEF